MAKIAMRISKQFFFFIDMLPIIFLFRTNVFTLFFFASGGKWVLFFFISPDDIVRPCCVSLFSSILFLVNCFASSSFSSAFQRPPKNAPCCKFHQNSTFKSFHLSNWKYYFLTEAVITMHHFSKKSYIFINVRFLFLAKHRTFMDAHFLLGSW